MSEPKGPPCGFLGLGPSSGDAANVDVGHDIDIVLQRSVDGHDGANVTREVSMADVDSIPTVGTLAKGHSKRPHNRHDEQPVRHGWSPETWSNIKLDLPAPEPFAYLLAKDPQKTVVRQAPMSLDSIPYTRSELLDLLGMFPEAPPSAYEKKSAYENKIEHDTGTQKMGKDPARHTKVEAGDVIDENFLYSIVSPKNLGGPFKQERDVTVKELDLLLDRIAQANIKNIELKILKSKLDKEPAVQQLRYEQTKRSADGFHELTYLIKARYSRAYEKAVREWKHKNDDDYYHPRDRLMKEGQEEQVHKQLSTFTEANVNSWAIDDHQDPTIVYSNKGVRILANDDPDLPFDERKELEFPGAPPRADQPGFFEFEEAWESMTRHRNIREKSNQDWEAYCLAQIATLGEEYLEGGPIPVAFDNRISKLLFKLKDDPYERTNALFQNNIVRKLNKQEFHRIVRDIRVRLMKERDTPGSLYNRYLALKQDLALRQLRREIVDKIGYKWYFVLQHIPPIELKPQTSHCAHPYCVYHESDFMPAGAYRLNFMNVKQSCDQQYWFEEISEGAGTPGRTEDGQMLFCVVCIENLFNGVGLIKAVDDECTVGDVSQHEEIRWRLPNREIDEEWDERLKISAEAAWSHKKQVGESAEGPDSSDLITDVPNVAALNAANVSAAPTQRSPGSEKAMHPQPPNITPLAMAPGLDIFAATLHTFIRPETRYTSSEFWTLNSYEYHAFMKWKNMCIRKLMWEVPSNRAFMLQHPGITADYDLVNFFGDDCLDINEPRPRIVAGVALDVEEVDADDISTLKVEANTPQNDDGRTRAAHPLSQVMNVDDSSTSELEDPSGDTTMEKLNRGRNRVLHPLSRIMALVDGRVQDVWATMDPPYFPRKSRDVLDRKWPPHHFWKSHFEKELEEQTEMELQKMIDENYETIDRRAKLIGMHGIVRKRKQIREARKSSHRTRTSHETSAEDSSTASGQNSADVVTPTRKVKKRKIGRFCTSCGTSDSPEWRTGPQGRHSLCNACGLRWFKEGRKKAATHDTDEMDEESP